MKMLKVIYCGWGERWQLGTLADNGSELLFEYSDEAMRQKLELSPRHLKLRSAAYSGFPDYQHRLPGLIADALPDGWGMLLMDRLFRQWGRALATLSPLDRLAFIGDRALGALSFEPADWASLAGADLELLALAKESQVLLAGKESESLRQLALLGGSPQGARPKVLVNHELGSGSVSTHPDSPGTPWLIKFQAAGEHKEVCALENLYAELARACQLDMPPTRYFDLDRKLAAFGVERFDVESGMRVPLHTLAGALHMNFRLPSMDYTTFLRAVRLFTHDEREVRKAFERAVFNVVFNNRDDHCKNFSFRLNRERHWQLAPCYDLTFCEGPGGEHFTDVCGEGRNPARSHLLRLAREGGVDPAFAAQAIDRISEVAGTFRTRAKAHPIRLATVKRVMAAIELNRRRMVG